MAWTRKDIFKYLITTVFLSAFAVLFFPFFSEILLAAIFALAMEPALGRWLQPRHFRWKISVALILFGMFIVLAFPINYVAYRTYLYFVKMSQTGVQNSELFQKLTELKNRASEFVSQLTSSWDLGTQFDLAGILDDGLTRSLNFIVGASTNIASQIPSLLISIFVFVAALYYFLAEARTLKTIFMKQRLLTGAESNSFIHLLQRSSYNTVITSIIIAAMQASIVAVGSLVFQMGEFPVIWAVTFFLSFIPVIGAAPVAIVLGLVELIMGSPGHAIGFLVVAVIAGASDNLVRPYLISSNEQDLNPVVSLLAIIGALLIFGMPGLFLGPVIASVAVKVIPVLFEDEVIPDPATEVGKDPGKKAT